MSIFGKILNFRQKTEEPKEEKHLTNREIFKEYDIRGIYGQNLFDEDAYLVGKGLINEDVKNIVVGYDGRISSPILAKRLINGMVTSGAHVTNIGLCHTPLLYFAFATGKFDLGIMVTGSHNPKDHNGFKIIDKDSTFFGAQIRKIYERIRSQAFMDGAGREILINTTARDYIKRIFHDIDIFGNINIAWDVGNGATSGVVRKIVKLLPGRHIVLNPEIDGNFPGRSPDPTKSENLAELIKVIKDECMDMGFAFDGDGDRVVVVTPRGECLQGDQLLTILARDMLKNNPGRNIVVDCKTSKMVTDDIIKNGGIPILERSGHSIIKSKMLRTNAILAGEMSGHMFISDRWYGFDDGVYTAIRLLEIYSKCRAEGVNIFTDLPQGFNTPEIRIDCENHMQVVKELKTFLTGQGIRIIDIDGIRVESEIGWWIIRPSNTQNQISIRIEGTSAENLTKLKTEVKNLLSGKNIIFPMEDKIIKN